MRNIPDNSVRLILAAISACYNFAELGTSLGIQYGMRSYSKDHDYAQSAEIRPSAGIHLYDQNRSAMPARPRRLLAVGAESACHAALKDYAVQLGGRMGCEAVVLTLTGSEPSLDRPARTGYDDASNVSRTAGCRLSRAGVQRPLIECLAPQGDVTSAVEQLCREIKRIEFILTDSDAIKELLSETAVVPVFRIVADTAHLPGGCTMSTHPVTIRKKPVGKTVVFGILTAALYAAVFWKADVLMKFFTRGGIYAALPIATAVIFSFAHGVFASSLWSLLGIHAKPRTEAYKTVSPSASAPQVKPKRPRVYAYVNPFHNIELKKK